MSAEEARRAVLELIRSRPGTFVGSPDPDRLAGLPLVDEGGGRFRFGAFSVHPAQGWYAATVGWDAPHAIEYHGRITLVGGKWVASEPAVRHLYH